MMSHHYHFTICVDPQHKLSWQKQQRELETKRAKLRRELFNRQDAIEAERNELINELELKLQQG